jgi:hypothetical protein
MECNSRGCRTRSACGGPASAAARRATHRCSERCPRSISA